MIPLKVTFLNFAETEIIRNTIQTKVDKLETFYDRIIRCEVVVSCPHRHRHADRQYQVHIHLFLPGEDVVVNRTPTQNDAHQDLYIAIRDSFHTAQRILQEKTKAARQKNKIHTERGTEIQFPEDDRISS